MMGLPNWLRGQQDDVDMTHDEPFVPPIAKVEPRLSKHGNFMPTDTGIEADPKKPLPFHIAPVGSTASKASDEASVVMQAHQFVEQWKIKDAAQIQKIEQLESDLKAEQRKSGLLELDIAQHLNTISTLQSEVLAHKERIRKFEDFFSVQRQINEKERLTYERFGIEAPPKKERKPNAKATKGKKEITNRKETDRPVEKDPTI